VSASTRQAWEAVYRQHRQGLFSLALSITGCPQTAEDAVHGAFVRLFRARCEGDGVAYAFAAVRNAAVDQVRRPAGRAVSIVDLPQRGPDGPESAAMEHEQRRLLDEAMARLSDEQREVIVMHLYAGLTFEQVGQALGQPLATVASRYRRALERLRELMRDQA
jgi:RNA polymerase sigma-70 factor (ECF subfamily)